MPPAKPPEPLLSVLYEIAGWLCLCGAALVAVFALLGGALLLGVAAGFVVVGLGLSGLFLLGIAQAVRYLGRTAHWAKLTHEVLASKFGEQAASRYSGPVPPVVVAGTPRVIYIEAERKAYCPACLRELPTDRLARGEQVCTRCGATFEVE